MLYLIVRLNSRAIFCPRTTERCTLEIDPTRPDSGALLHLLFMIFQHLQHQIAFPQDALIPLGMNPTPALGENPAKSAEQILPIRVIVKDPAAFNPTADNVMRRSGGINAGSARHDGILP
jgi:hypothetical protein